MEKIIKNFLTYLFGIYLAYLIMYVVFKTYITGFVGIGFSLAVSVTVFENWKTIKGFFIRK